MVKVILLVGGEGIEPSLPCENQILSLARLPIPPLARISIISHFSCYNRKYMDSENGGLSSSDRQRQTAAEIARKKVLAVYSSTVENLRNLPASSRERLIKNRERHTNRFNETPTPQQQVQPDWSHNNINYPTAEYQRTPVYSQEPTTKQPVGNAYQQEYAAPVENNYDAAPAESPTYVGETNYNTNETPSALKDTPVNQEAISEEWQKYHSAWQDYYKNYYSEYYAKAAQTYLETEKLKTERIATGATERKRNLRRLTPIFIIGAIILTALFLQYNRRIFAPIMAYISPDTGSVNTGLTAVDPSITQTVSPDPRLIIPKLNIDVPVAFGISVSEVDAAMNQGVAQFSIPGANALPGQIGNLAISGHSAGDIYSSNPYKFIFSGLERLEVGDLIYINYDSVRYTYQMTSSKVVEPTDVAALIYETDRPMLTLITCTPLGTSRYRLLISAEQISPAYSSDNVAEPTTPEDTPDTGNSMPANEPSFFENLWNSIFGS